ncbi:MAG: TonB-dependent receptor [Cytophagales bacterium]|nr:TonB-dependent receptor [Cytophagales bacterium]
MKICRLEILVVFIFFSNSLLAQNLLIIKDLKTNNPLSGATVRIHNKGIVSISDEEGHADISKIDVNEKLIVSFIGYQTLEYTVTEGENKVFLEPDFKMLNSLTVIGHNNQKKISDISGSYAINSRIVMDRFNDESLVRSMNTLPGIRMEERSPSSYRVSIRGNLLRAPFGVRNVKVYWNNIPYTDPTGNTPLNLVDLNNIGRIETIKGPAGSIYGAGMGGVLNIYSKVPNLKSVSADMGYTVGSYGYHKVTTNVNIADENHRFSIKYAKQKGDGYRDHTNFDREVIQVGGTFFTSENRILSTQVLYTDLFYQLPGGLTKEQYDENPRQSRPGAAAKNTSIDHQNFLVGLVQDYEWNERLKNVTAIYYTNGIKENPFINNYELEKLKSFGGRTSFDIRTNIGNLPATFTAGTEINYGIFHASNHGNIDGHADTLRYEDKLNSLQTFLFAQADLQLSNRWKLDAGASLNYLNYDIFRLKDTAQDTSYQLARTFRPEFIPRIGIVGRLADNVSVHGSVSSGFSPPTTEEVRTSDGGINTDLEAERGINYELGVRGNSGNEKLYFDATTFWMQQKETIVSKTTEFGTVVFENAGSTSQFGIEALIGYAFIRDASKNISLLKVQSAYTYHNFTFENYVKKSRDDNVDYSGNSLTGTSPNILVTTFDLESGKGLYLNVTYNFTDRIPLDDANTVFADSYNLITAKTGWKINYKQRHLLELFAGVDNLLNEKYSLGNDLNAFGQRYFNPSPERNYFGGLRLYFNKY